MWQIENAVTDVLALDIDSGFLCNGRPCTCPVRDIAFGFLLWTETRYSDEIAAAYTIKKTCCQRTSLNVIAFAGETPRRRHFHGKVLRTRYLPFALDRRHFDPGLLGYFAANNERIFDNKWR